MAGSKTLLEDGSPDDKSMSGTAAGETKFNPKEVTFNELEEFKHHLESLEPSARTEVLNQLRTFSHQANTEETNKSLLDSKDDIKRRLWTETTSIIKEDNSESRKMDKEGSIRAHCKCTKPQQYDSLKATVIGFRDHPNFMHR
jgi:hypothetical protein